MKFFVQTYLRYLVRISLWRHKPEVVVVAGITNKSTVKRVIASRLSATGLSVRSNPKSYNTEIGLPLAILALAAGGSSVRAWWRSLAQGTWRALVGKKFPGLLVLEFGISGRGDMRELLKIVKPRMAGFTNVVLSDFNPHATIEELTGEFEVLMRNIPTGGYAIVNADDPQLEMLCEKKYCATVTYALHQPADLTAAGVRQEIDGQHFVVNGREIVVARFGDHHIYAYLAGEAVAQCYNV